MTVEAKEETMKIYYHNDLDGQCAAAIARMKYARECRGSERMEFLEMDYALEPCVDAIQLDETVLILDFSFTPETMDEVLKRTVRVIWIDHHKTAASYNYGVTLDGLRDFNGRLSACELSWAYFFARNEMPKAVKLIGDRDVWRWQFGPITAEFNEGMKTYDTHPTADLWRTLLGAAGSFQIENVREKGKTVLEYKKCLSEQQCQSCGFETELAGHKVYAVNQRIFGQDVFGNRKKTYPICATYVHDGRRFTVSLYTEREDIDVGAICKALGGGGHRQAAGFVCEALPFAMRETQDD